MNVVRNYEVGVRIDAGVRYVKILKTIGNFDELLIGLTMGRLLVSSSSETDRGLGV